MLKLKPYPDAQSIVIEAERRIQSDALPSIQSRRLLYLAQSCLGTKDVLSISYGCKPPNYQLIFI